ncbi:MAG: hypothetical protein AB7S26_06725 [Sandaracinaceae bacterium]
MTKSLAFALTSLLALVGCGAQSSALSASTTPEHLRTDNDRYAAAYGEAFATYQAEVELAVARTYGTRLEAEAVAASHMSQRFYGHLEHALARRGLSMRGFRLHQSHHPELTAHLDRDFDVTEVRTTAIAIAERVDPIAPLMVAFDERDDADDVALAQR